MVAMFFSHTVPEFLCLQIPKDSAIASCNKSRDLDLMTAVRGGPCHRCQEKQVEEERTRKRGKAEEEKKQKMREEEEMDRKWLKIKN
jgi:hypothetical protein